MWPSSQLLNDAEFVRVVQVCMDVDYDVTTYACSGIFVIHNIIRLWLVHLSPVFEYYLYALSTFGVLDT